MGGRLPRWLIRAHLANYSPSFKRASLERGSTRRSERGQMLLTFSDHLTKENSTPRMYAPVLAGCCYVRRELSAPFPGPRSSSLPTATHPSSSHTLFFAIRHPEWIPQLYCPRHRTKKRGRKEMRLYSTAIPPRLPPDSSSFSPPHAR